MVEFSTQWKGTSTGELFCVPRACLHVTSAAIVDSYVVFWIDIPVTKYGLVVIATPLCSEAPVSKCVQTEGHLATAAQSSKADTAKEASRV